MSRKSRISEPLMMLAVVAVVVLVAVLMRLHREHASAAAPLSLSDSACAAPAVLPTATPAEAKLPLVLNYHAITSDGRYGSLSTAAFHRQMLCLRDLGFTPVSLADAIAGARGEKALPPRSVLLCFDRADADFVRYAFPVLNLLDYPAAVQADGRNLASEPSSLTPTQLVNLSRRGAGVICATRLRLSSEAWESARDAGGTTLRELMRSEIVDCLRNFRELLGRCEVLSLPEGISLRNSSRELDAAGCRLTMVAGLSSAQAPGAAVLERRDVASSEDFAAILSGGSAEREADILNRLKACALPAGSPGTPGWQPIMDVDAEIAEAADPDFLDLEADAPPVPTCGRLARRHGTGDWITTSFDAPLVPRDRTRVAVLGYHNFSNTKKVTDMRMRTSEFCTQMQYIRDAGLSVITMQDFLEWRRGRRCLPERCVLITIDDGWKSVYTDAYPVLKAYGYPFTLFLYTRYIGVQGDSMTKDMIREMAQNGATLGSHSTNHLYPSAWKKVPQDSPAYAEKIRVEMLDSGDRLAALFPPSPCSTYCYPGGYNTPPMIEALSTSRYKAAFTVLEKKVSCTEPVYLVHRYMVFGTQPEIFRRAVNFDGSGNAPKQRAAIAAAKTRARAFFPAAFPNAGGVTTEPGAGPALPGSTGRGTAHAVSGKGARGGASAVAPGASAQPSALPPLPTDEDIAVDPDEEVEEEAETTELPELPEYPEF